MAERVWDGREPLTESLERDYADMKGEGWDVVWMPTSPLTTPWENAALWARPDPEQHVRTAMMAKPSRRRRQRVEILIGLPRLVIQQVGRGHR